MAVVAILLGFGCGMLFAAVGFCLWSGLAGDQALSRGARAVAWSAAAVLVVDALLAWGSGLPALESIVGVVNGGDLGGPARSLILMAALAVPLKGKGSREARWSQAFLYVPALLLSAMALAPMVMRSPDTVSSTDWVTPIRFALAVCAGVGARAMGQALRAMMSGTFPGERSGALTYGLLTLVAGSAALANLWQRGRLWVGADPVLRGGMAGAWLGWTADWLTPSRDVRLRAPLTVVAAVLLILAAIKPA